MAIRKKKISELPEAKDFSGLLTVGVQESPTQPKRSVKVNLQKLADAADAMKKSTALANTAALKANESASSADQAVANMSAEFEKKADKTQVAKDLKTKADKTQVDKDLATKASKEEVTQEKARIDAELLKKMEKEGVEQRVLVNMLATLCARVEALEEQTSTHGDIKADSITSADIPMVCGRPMILVGSDVPSATTIPERIGIPDFHGQIYIDTAHKKVYSAVGTGSISDWVILN